VLIDARLNAPLRRELKEPLHGHARVGVARIRFDGLQLLGFVGMEETVKVTKRVVQQLPVRRGRRRLVGRLDLERLV